MWMWEMEFLTLPPYPANSVVLAGGYTRTRENLMQNAKLPHPVQYELTYPDENFKVLVEVLRFKAFYKTK